MGTSRDGESIVIDLRQITYLIKKSILWILLAALAGGIFGYGKASRDFPAYYIADVDFLVYSRQGEMLFPEKSEEDDMVVSEETPEEVLINTYSSVITSDSVLQRVIDDLSLDWSLSRLRSAITVESEKGSRIMNVSVQASRSETALDIADKLAEIYPEIVEKNVGVGAIRPIGKASLQGGAIRDNRRKYAFMGAAICAALMFLLLVVTRLLDPTIRLDTDVTRELGIPILGAIMDEQSVRRGKSLLGGDMPDLQAAVTDRLTAVAGGRKKGPDPKENKGISRETGNAADRLYTKVRTAEEAVEAAAASIEQTTAAAGPVTETAGPMTEAAADPGRDQAEAQPVPQVSGWRKAGRTAKTDRTAETDGAAVRMKDAAVPESVQQESPAYSKEQEQAGSAPESTADVSGGSSAGKQGIAEAKAEAKKKDRYPAESETEAGRDTYRALRIRFLHALQGTGGNVAMLCGCGGGENTEEIIVKLAVSLASQGRRVLVADCSLRAGTLTGGLGVSGRRRGLSDCLNGSVSDWRQCVLKLRRYGFSFLPAGTTHGEGPDSAELLGTAAMRKVLRDLSNTYDVVLCAAPPAALTTDAAALAPGTDGTVVIAAHGRTRRAAAAVVIEQIGCTGSHVLGLILSGYDPDRAGAAAFSNFAYYSR
ncbi:MAG TPA: hypothetical protein DCR16_01990 [Lachnospiraceae bacterium]|nr:hypothetical protein [Lachnospiraceae bacterium]